MGRLKTFLKNKYKNNTDKGIEMKKIGIITKHNIADAYSCLLYLNDSLNKKYDVDLWGYALVDEVPADNYHSFRDTWYANIRWFRKYLVKISVFLLARHYDVLIINDLDFFWVAYYIKKFYPNKKVVHYNTEIPGPDVKLPKFTTNFYKKHASFPDLIIECLKERAQYRKKEFNISKEIIYVNNTIPQEKINNALKIKDPAISKYFLFDNGLPILIYAGGCNLSRNLGEIIKSAGKFSKKLQYIFFCYGTERDFSAVQKECDKYDNCHLFKSVDRTTLLNVMNNCNIGIQYYDPDVSMNHYLASPSKLFEYLGTGLNVVSSNNHGVDRIIEQDELGVCFDNSEGISNGIEKLLNKGLKSRNDIKNVFKTKYCYEIDSKQMLGQLYSLID